MYFVLLSVSHGGNFVNFSISMQAHFFVCFSFDDELLLSFLDGEEDAYSRSVHKIIIIKKNL